MTFGLFEMLLESLGKFRRVGGLGHFWQGLDQLRFRAVEVFELFDVNVM